MPWSVGTHIPSQCSRIPSCCFAAVPEQLWDAQRVASLCVCPTPTPDVGGMRLCKPLGVLLAPFRTHPTLHRTIPLAKGSLYPPTSVELLLTVVSWWSPKHFFPLFLGEQMNAGGQKQLEIKGSSGGCSSEVLVGEGLTLSCVSLSHDDGDLWTSLQGKPTQLLILGRLHGIRTQPLKAVSVVGKYLANQWMDKKAARLSSMGNQCGINHPLFLGWHLGALPTLGPETGAAHHPMVVGKDATMRTAQAFSTFFSLLTLYILLRGLSFCPAPQGVICSGYVMSNLHLLYLLIWVMEVQDGETLGGLLGQPPPFLLLYVNGKISWKVLAAEEEWTGWW